MLSSIFREDKKITLFERKAEVEVIRIRLSLPIAALAPFNKKETKKDQKDIRWEAKERSILNKKATWQQLERQDEKEAIKNLQDEKEAINNLIIYVSII